MDLGSPVNPAENLRRTSSDHGVWFSNGANKPPIVKQYTLELWSDSFHTSNGRKAFIVTGHG
jgi:hypothetical protein